MICWRCGSQNEEGKQRCSFCGALLYEAEAGKKSENQAGTLNNDRAKIPGIILKVMAVLCGIFYLVMGAWRIPSLASNVLFIFQRPSIWSFTNALSVLLSIAACVLFALSLLLLAVGGTEEREDNRGQLYLFTVAAAALRILAAVAGILLVTIGYLLSGYRFSIWRSGLLLQLLKVILCAVFIEGILFLGGYLSGGRLKLKASKDGLSSMSADVIAAVRIAAEGLLRKGQENSDASSVGAMNSGNTDFHAGTGSNAGVRTYGQGSQQAYGGGSQPAYAQGSQYAYGQGGQPPHGQSSQQAYDQSVQSQHDRTSSRSNTYGGRMAGQSYQNMPGAGAYQAAAWSDTSNYGYIPRERLKEDRSLVLYIVFSILTCGIYGFYFIHSTAKDLNVICSEDGNATKGPLGYIGLTIVSCGIYSYYWGASFVDRMAFNAPRYGVTVEESGTTYILWNFPGILLCCVGPFIAQHIIIKNLNKLARAYNEKYHL